MFSLNSSQNTETITAHAAETVRVVIKGRVQEVFYRNWTVDNAKELGLKGCVRNRRDGSVEALFSGRPEKVKEMEQRCSRGPPAAKVTGLQYDFNEAIDHDTEEDENTLPEDVEEGHFAVHTVDDGELRRFVVELSYLADPGFLKLLEQAEQEFGFEQMGILVIPCTYSDLQSVIGKKEKH